MTLIILDLGIGSSWSIVPLVKLNGSVVCANATAVMNCTCKHQLQSVNSVAVGNDSC